MPAILLVDNDSLVRNSLCRALGAEALQVTAARGVKDALDYLFRHTPDLVIMDMCMAPLAGWDLIAHLRSRHPALPIFLITALPRSLVGEDIREIAAYFKKPFDLAALIMAIQRQLGQSGSGHGSSPLPP